MLSKRPASGLPSWQLFAVAVLIWGTTWHAITYQLSEAPIPFSVGLRFALAAAACAVVARLQGEPLELAAGHRRVALIQGLFMYSTSYLCVYEAEHHIPSGLVAVGYSLSPMINGVAAHWIWRTPLSTRFVVGAAASVMGVALLFAPQWSEAGTHGDPLRGAVYTAVAVGLSSIGSLWASRNAQRGMPFWSTMAWGMAGGATISLTWALSQQAVPSQWPSVAWWASLSYLALAGSAIAFACYLTLQRRWGPGQAATVGVATPVLALAVSTALEGFVPTVLTAVGIALALLGNAWSLGWGARRSQDAGGS